jgi:ABC-type multidrug transport system fused ATPase/permease subunit
MGKVDASEEELREALHTAVADFVFDLPQGLDTPCFESGGGLSEGQAQRIAIARALLRPGNILLLDEFSSALDGQTETLLMERLLAQRPAETMIFITHREIVSQYCDHTLKL